MRPEITASDLAKPAGRLPASQTMRIEMVLPLRHRPELESFIQDVSDRTSPNYRHYVTVEQFADRFGPSQQDYDALVSFAKANGFTVESTSRNRMNVGVRATVVTIEKALHVKMNVYQHPTEHRMFYAPDREPSVDLPFQLWHIGGLDNYSTPRPAVEHKEASALQTLQAAFTGSGPGGNYLGSDMRAAYYGSNILAGGGQSVGLFELQGTDLNDLYTYYNNIGQTLYVPINLISVDGTSTSCVNGCNDAQPTEDMTSALGMAPSLYKLDVYVGSSDVAIWNAMATASILNAQLSCAWLFEPADPTAGDPYFLEFAAQGQTLFVATGRNGTWNSSFQTYPSDDPYVTSVGGTSLQTQYAGGPWAAESTWSSTGGGISPHQFAQPFWQSGVITAGCEGCSTVYRNGPDVAANADYNFYSCTNQNGCSGYWGGTGFSAAMWAGYMALANQQAHVMGNPPVGFINPDLYFFGLSSVYGSYFHDITTGGNNAYSATPGFDLVTGWGSPAGQNLVYALAVEPGFKLSASPKTLSVVQGNSVSSTVSATISGFSANIALAAAGVPTGAALSLSSNSVAPGVNSTLTITTSLATPPGTYPITVTGTSYPYTGSTTVMLTVAAAPPGFRVIARPGTITVKRGNAGTSFIHTYINGTFNAPITLKLTKGVTGTTVSFNPKTIAAPGAGISTMTVKVAATVAPGTYAMTVEAVGGGITHKIPMTLVVQ
jgi:kumamolisin